MAADLDLGGAPKLRCTNCPNTTTSSREVAEFVQGWRLWEGRTVAGEIRKVTLCPTCSGCAPESATQDPGWGWECYTCHAEYEPWDDEPPLTEQEAKRSAEDHQCDPDMRVYKIEPDERAVVTVPTLAGVL